MSRILGVDDERGVRKLLQDILAIKGYECMTAGDTAEARNLLNDHQIDLVLCDIHMPGESGLDFLRNILPEYPETAAMIITGDSDKQMVDAALKIGVYDYIDKPIERDRLLISVANALHRRELEIQGRLYQNRLEEEIAHRTQAFQESEERFRSLFENSKDIIFIFSRDGRLLEINEAGLELFGYSKEETRTLSATDFFQNRTDFNMLFRKIRRDGFVKDFFNDIKCKDGRLVPTIITVSTRRDDTGNIIEFQGILRDITRERKSRKKLKASEAKYRELVQSANSIILKLDTAGRVTFINDFAQHFFGYSETEILNQSAIGTIVPAMDSDGLDLAAMVKDLVLDPEKTTINENENMRRNGERIWVSWTNKPILSDQGEITGILCIGQDISERKRAVQALHRNYDFLQQLIDKIPSAVYYKDVDGIYGLCNTSFEAAVGLPKSEIIGKTIFDFVPGIWPTPIAPSTRSCCANRGPNPMKAGSNYPRPEIRCHNQ